MTEFKKLEKVSEAICQKYGCKDAQKHKRFMHDSFRKYTEYFKSNGAEGIAPDKAAMKEVTADSIEHHAQGLTATMGEELHAIRVD